MSVHIQPTGITFASEPAEPDLCVKRRFQGYIAFMDEMGRNVLDVGNRGVMTGLFEKHYSMTLTNTGETNFNDSVISPRAPHDTVFCFEVLEHVMNPLQFLLQIKALMTPNGVLYLSTPKAPWISWYQSPWHFTEYKPDRLQTLFHEAGLKIERQTEFRPFPWYFMFWGVRPVIRLLLHKTLLFKLKSA